MLRQVSLETTPAINRTPKQQKLGNLKLTTQNCTPLSSAMHTTYCMGNYLCRFHFPVMYSDQTTIEWVPDSTNKDLWILRVITKRNDRWAVMHPHLMLQAHRANVNAQVILELQVHLDYVTKYATKIEERSDNASIVLQHLEDIADRNISSSGGVAKSLAIRAAGNHDRSSHEVAHYLQGLEFAVSNIPQSRFKSLSLNNTRKVNTYTRKTQHSFLDHYAHRNAENSRGHLEIIDMSLNMLAPLFDYEVKNNLWKKLLISDKKVMSYFPNYGSNPKSKNYALFCKFALIVFRPWRVPIVDACTRWTGGPLTPATQHITTS